MGCSSVFVKMRSTSVICYCSRGPGRGSSISPSSRLCEELTSPLADGLKDEIQHLCNHFVRSTFRAGQDNAGTQGQNLRYLRTAAPAIEGLTFVHFQHQWGNWTLSSHRYLLCDHLTLSPLFI